MRYSLFALARNAWSRHERWPRAWRSPDLKPAYDVIIVGGGHGLATAYYLAKNHGVRSVAVVEGSATGLGKLPQGRTPTRHLIGKRQQSKPSW